MQRHVQPDGAQAPSWWARSIFWYVVPVIKVAKKAGHLEVTDIPAHVRLVTSELYDRFHTALQARKQALKNRPEKKLKSKKGKPPRVRTGAMDLLIALLSGRKAVFLLTAVGYAMSQAAGLAGPLLVKQITEGLTCRQAAEDAAEQGVPAAQLPSCPSKASSYLWVIGLFLVPLVQSFVETNYTFQLEKLGVQFRNSLMAAIYRKCLTLDNAALSKQPTGKIVTHMSNDAQKMQEVTQMIHAVWGAPIIIIAVTALLWQQIQWATFVGLAVNLMLVPFTAFVAKKLAKLRREIVGFTDKRTSTMDEVISGMRVIKFYAWEVPFRQQAAKYRAEEAKRLKKIAWLQGVFSLVLFAGPVFVSIISFMAYELAGNDLTVPNTFAALGFFQLLRFPLGFLPQIIMSAVSAKVALTRISGFLSSSEVGKRGEDPGFIESGEVGRVKITDASFKWDEDAERDVTLKDINLECDPGQLVMIVGAVGCGKSSLLATLFRQITRLHGTVQVAGKIAYVPQTAWIMNETVRENVLMGRPMDERRYKHALTAAQLASDLELFDDEDLTEIGERGITLSGGQKQRVSLARAIYSDADIFILDDPLSAVDAHVGQALFEQCICGALRGKTVLLVTNALHYVHRADRLVWLVDGAVRKQGTYEEVSGDAEFHHLIGGHVVAEDTGPAAKDGSGGKGGGKGGQGPLAKMNVGDVKAKGLTGNEERASGAVSLKVVISYIVAGGGILWVLRMLVAYICEFGAKNIIDLWAGWWAESNFGKRGDAFYLGIYGGLAVFFGIATYVRAIMFAFGCVAASVRLHNRLLDAIMRLPSTFFDTNPSGRIINRFSRDTEIMDAVLPMSLMQVGSCIANYISTLILISVAVQWFLLALPPLTILYFVIQRYYIPLARELQRLEAVTRSPIYATFGEAVNGITSIRAYGAQEHFTKLEDTLIQDNGVVYLTQRSGAAWLSQRLDMIGLTVIVTAALMIIGFDIEVVLGAAALTYSLELTKYLKFGTRMISKAEADFNSAERILQYINVEPEAAPELDSDPTPEEWPSKGGVSVRGLVLRYRPNLPTVLKNVNFEVAPAAHIGIVGRTGSGKSSLFLAFFRMVEPEAGAIVIDGVDTKEMGLRAVRRGLSMIPQDPFMFNGTVRRNLDPFTQYSDIEVWQALERVTLKRVIMDMEQKLEAPVSDNGGNFSQGQRQLFCLARALLRRSKILMMDEATASVDLDTDVLIQRVVRSEFKHCTVLTIAHRLNTIMDADKVLVMEAGRAAEFDSPAALLDNDKSIFTSLVNNTGVHAAARLRRLAQRSNQHPAELEAHSGPNSDSSSPAAAYVTANGEDPPPPAPLPRSTVERVNPLFVQPHEESDDVDLGASIYGSSGHRTARASLASSAPRMSTGTRHSSDMRPSQRRFSDMLDAEDFKQGALAPGPAAASDHVVEHHHSVEAADIGDEHQNGNPAANAPVPDLEMRQMER